MNVSPLLSLPCLCRSGLTIKLIFLHRDTQTTNSLVEPLVFRIVWDVTRAPSGTPRPLDTEPLGSVSQQYYATGQSKHTCCVFSRFKLHSQVDISVSS